MIVLTISLNIEDNMVRVVTNSENSSRDVGVDYDDGVSALTEDILRQVLGEVALFSWETSVRKLLDV